MVRGGVVRSNHTAPVTQHRKHPDADPRRRQGWKERVCAILHRIPDEMALAGGYLDLAAIGGLPIKVRNPPLGEEHLNRRSAEARVLLDGVVQDAITNRDWK